MTEGTELIAELSQAELDAAVVKLVPPHFLAGEDARTPNQLRVYRRPRERAAALLWELPAGTTPFDLHAPARELSRRARTIVWDSWPSVTLVEHVAGEETSRFDPGHNGEWRGTPWFSIESGEVRAPFAVPLAQLLHDRKDEEFLAGLLDELYGVARTPEPLATYHHAFDIAAESDALAPLLRAVIARALRDGRTEVRGLGTFVSIDGAPPAYQYRRESVDLDDWRDVLTLAECTAATEALRQLIDRIVPAMHLVVPGLACFGCTEFPDYHSKNPRTGEPVFVPGKRVLGVTLLPPR